MEVDTNETRRLERLEELSAVLQGVFVTQTSTHYEFAAASGTQTSREFDDR